jgi:replication factor A2
VSNSSKTATNVSYEIGDGTGYVDVRQWLDTADDEAGKTTGITQDMYVSVIGTLKVFGGKRHISAQIIHVVTNPDLVASHLLKALSLSLAARNPSGGVSIPFMFNCGAPCADSICRTHPQRPRPPTTPAQPPPTPRPSRLTTFPTSSARS